MASRSFLGGIKAGRGLTAVMAATWVVLAASGAKLWSDSTWRTGSASTTQALAAQAMAQLGTARRPAPARLDAAERLVRAELGFGPYRPVAWCRLAYIQFLRVGRLDAAAVESLRRSYQVAPFQTDAVLWRSQFIFQHWDQAPIDLKQSALRETRAFYSVWANRKPIEMMAARVDNPAGRLALQLVLLQAPTPGVRPS